MPTIIPVYSAADFEFLEARETIYSSLASVRVKASEESYPVAMSSLELTGETFAPSLEAMRIKGDVLTEAYGSVDNGEVPDSAGLAGFATGLFYHDPAPSIIELSGEGLALALSNLAVGNYPSLIGSVIYQSMASLALRTGQLYPGLGSFSARALLLRSATAGLAAKGLADSAAQATLETAQEESGAPNPALSALDCGDVADAIALASLDAQEGEGVEFIVDIQDDILDSGGGDD